MTRRDVLDWIERQPDMASETITHEEIAGWVNEAADVALARGKEVERLRQLAHDEHALNQALIDRINELEAEVKRLRAENAVLWSVAESADTDTCSDETLAEWHALQGQARSDGAAASHLLRPPVPDYTSEDIAAIKRAVEEGRIADAQRIILARLTAEREERAE